VAFDKTGTLTEGKPSVVALVAASGTSRGEVLRLAAALQSGSEHPLARAVLTLAAGEGIAAVPAHAVRALPGRGMEAVVEDRTLQLGSLRMMDEAGLDTAAFATEADMLRAQGRSLSFLADIAARRVLGMVAFGDALKPTARSAIASLRARGIHTVMLTGDNAGSAHAAADALGIDEVIADILPGDKAAAIARLKQNGRVVAMVGDGVNDAPALAAADVGIAMSTGTDVAMQAAGITLMRGDPGLVADAIDISRRSYAKNRGGLFWAFIYNLVGIPLAAMGLLNPMLAGAAMALSSVSVVSNALLLRRWKPRA
jgi:Cu+-exporting ATPase